MATDMTTLGLGVDSSGVRTATGDLDAMAAAGKRAEGSATDLEASMTKSVFTANEMSRAVSQVIESVVGLTKGFIDLAFQVADYQDLADVSNADPAGLASMRTAADVAGVSIASVNHAMTQMVRIVQSTNDENKNAAKAVKALGLEWETFKNMRPDEQYRAVAVALNEFEDSGKKTAIAQALMSRGGAEQLKVMKELANEQGQQTILTNAQIKATDEMADRIARSRSQLAQTAAMIFSSVLPALSGFMTAVTQSTNSVTGLDNEAQRLKASDALGTFADNAVTALGFVVDAADGVGRAFRITGTLLGGLAAIAVSVASGEFRQVKTIIDEMLADRDRILNESLFSDRLKTALADARKAAAEAGQPPPARRELTDLNFNTPRARKAKEETDEYGKLIAKVQTRLEQERQEQEADANLTAMQRFRIAVIADVDKVFGKLTVTQMLNIDTMLEELVAIERVNLARERDVKFMEEASRATEKLLDDQQRLADTRRDEADQALIELQAFGRTQEEVNALATARLRDAAAALQQRRMVEDFNPAAVEYNRLIDAQVASILAAADARDRLTEAQRRAARNPEEGAQRAITNYLREIEEAGIAAEAATSRVLHTIEDGLTQLFTKGELDARAFIDQLIAEFVRLEIVRPLMAGLLTGNFASPGIFGAMFGGLLGAKGAWQGMVLGNGEDYDEFKYGGVVTQPSWFRYGGGRMGKMAEGGRAEGILPLARTPSGDLGVQTTGRGGGIVIEVNQTINVQGGASVNDLEMAMLAAKNSAKAEIAEQVARGSRSY